MREVRSKLKLGDLVNESEGCNHGDDLNNLSYKYATL